MNIESFDLYNPPTDFINNVYKYYKLLREKSPIHQNPDGSYVLTTYKEIISVYRNFKIWSSDKKTEFVLSKVKIPSYFGYLILGIFIAYCKVS